MTKDDMEIVSAVHRALAGKVGQERFAVWFGRGVRMEPCGKTLRIAAADTFRLDYLRRAFRGSDRSGPHRVQRSAGCALEDIEFVVDPALAEKSAAQDVGATGGHSRAGSSDDGSSANTQIVRRADFAAGRFRPCDRSHGTSSMTMHRHACRDGSLRAWRFFGERAKSRCFLSRPTSRDRPGVYTPLTIVGPPGSGKTHLLEGIWRHVRMSPARCTA